MKKFESSINILGSFFSIASGLFGVYLYFTNQIIIDKTLLIVLAIFFFLFFIRITLREASYFEKYFIKLCIAIGLYPAGSILYYRLVLVRSTESINGFAIFTMVFGMAYYVILFYMAFIWYTETEVLWNKEFGDTNNEENLSDSKDDVSGIV